MPCSFYILWVLFSRFLYLSHVIVTHTQRGPKNECVCVCVCLHKCMWCLSTCLSSTTHGAKETQIVWEWKRKREGKKKGRETRVKAAGHTQLWLVLQRVQQPISLFNCLSLPLSPSLSLTLSLYIYIYLSLFCTISFVYYLHCLLDTP